MRRRTRIDEFGVTRPVVDRVPLEDSDSSPDELVVVDPHTGRRRRLVKLNRYSVDRRVGGFEDDVDETGIIRVEHTIDPETKETLKELRSGVPVAAAVGGALAGVALALFMVWALSDDHE